jgi:hypothetical protein
MVLVSLYLRMAAGLPEPLKCMCDSFKVARTRSRLFVSHQIDAMSSEPSSETATRVRWILADLLLLSRLQIELVAV